MYMEIRNIHNTYPNTKIVTLTGNVHNSFAPLFDKKRIGGYLLKDSVNFARQKKRDSILNARKNKANLPKPPEEDDNGEGGI